MKKIQPGLERLLQTIIDNVDLLDKTPRKQDIEIIIIALNSAWQKGKDDYHEQLSRDMYPRGN